MRFDRTVIYRLNVFANVTAVHLRTADQGEAESNVCIFDETCEFDLRR